MKPTRVKLLLHAKLFQDTKQEASITNVNLVSAAYVIPQIAYTSSRLTVVDV